LKDETAILKGEKARPTLKPSRMGPEAVPEAKSGTESESSPSGDAADEPATKRPGSAKRGKTAEIKIHRETKCPRRRFPGDQSSGAMSRMWCGK
jgi:hypothetical protein